MAEYLRTNFVCRLPRLSNVAKHRKKMKERTLKKGYKNGTTYNSLLSQLVYGGLLPTPQAADSFNWCSNRTERPLYHYEERDVSESESERFERKCGTWKDFPSDEHTDCVGLEGRLDKGKNPSLQRTSLRGEIHADYGIGKTSQLNPLFVEEMMGFPTYWILMPFLKAPGPSVKTLIPDGGQKQ